MYYITILISPVYSIYVHDWEHLAECNHQQRDGSSIGVKKWKPIIPWALEKYQTHQTTEHAGDT